jgi:hypothetical protein
MRSTYIVAVYCAACAHDNSLIDKALNCDKRVLRSLDADGKAFMQKVFESGPIEYYKRERAGTGGSEVRYTLLLQMASHILSVLLCDVCDTVAFVTSTCRSFTVHVLNQSLHKCAGASD